MEDRADNVLFRRGADDLAVLEQVSPATPQRNAQIGAARLPGAVDGAAHKRHREVLGELAGLDCCLYLLDDRKQIAVEPATGRTRDNIDARSPQAQRLQDGVARFDFLDGVRGERYANRVSDAIGKQSTNADGTLDGAWAAISR